ncbi:MAG: hypothetical protein M1827_006931 [Pycnora praestabilis]|nr:MAG: hypothetical protein M1827_006931 [Pycnora praestabilis]
MENPAPTSSSSSKQDNIGVIICSQRTPRVGPSVTDFVLSVLHQHLTTPSSSPSSSINLLPIDLADQNLPLYDEPSIPSEIKDPSQYAHAHTRAWSEKISSLSALIFVTPQYNWGYPASIKNAIDYLYHEWKGKPAFIISYGGRGGGFAAEQLRQVLKGGVGMRVVETAPGLAFKGRAMLVKAALKGELVLDVEGEEGKGAWDGEKESILKGWEELRNLLEEGPELQAELKDMRAAGEK